jgi:hypothetical protein
MYYDSVLPILGAKCLKTVTPQPDATLLSGWRSHCNPNSVKEEFKPAGRVVNTLDLQSILRVSARIRVRVRIRAYRVRFRLGPGFLYWLGKKTQLAMDIAYSLGKKIRIPARAHTKLWIQKEDVVPCMYLSVYARASKISHTSGGQ